MTDRLQQPRRDRRLAPRRDERRRAHRRGDLDRVRHPRLPRPERRVDEEPRGREDRDAPVLHVGSGDPPRSRGRTGCDSEMWNAQPNAAHHALVELEHKDALHLLVTQNVDGLHHARRPVARARRRDPRQRARGEVHVVRLARPDGRDARARARRRGRSDVPRLRRHHQVGDDLASARTSSPRTSTGRSGRRRTPTSSSRSARRSASTRPPRCPRSRCATGARLDRRQRRGDAVRRRRRRRRPRARSATSLPALVALGLSEHGVWRSAGGNISGRPAVGDFRPSR